MPEQRICGVAGQVTRAAASTSPSARADVGPPDSTQISDAVEVVASVTVTCRSVGEVLHDDITTWVWPVG